MDAAGMVDWVKNVWERRPGALLRRRALLVMDSFAGREDQDVKNQLNRGRTIIAIIPGGLTSVCQPLDVSLNRPFKQGVKKRWVKWMETGHHTFTPTGRQCAPTLELLCQWVKEACDDVRVETAVKSFKKCGISNALDGTEDDALFMDSSEESGDSSEDESDSSEVADIGEHDSDED